MHVVLIDLVCYFSEVGGAIGSRKGTAVDHAASGEEGVTHDAVFFLAKRNQILVPPYFFVLEAEGEFLSVEEAALGKEDLAVEFLLLVLAGDEESLEFPDLGDYLVELVALGLELLVGDRELFVELADHFLLEDDFLVDLVEAEDREDPLAEGLGCEVDLLDVVGLEVGVGLEFGLDGVLDLGRDVVDVHALEAADEVHVGDGLAHGLPVFLLLEQDAHALQGELHQRVRVLVHLDLRDVVSVEGVECFVGGVQGRQGLAEYPVRFLLLVQSLLRLLQDGLLLLLDHGLDLAGLEPVHLQLPEQVLLLYGLDLQDGLHLGQFYFELLDDVVGFLQLLHSV